MKIKNINEISLKMLGEKTPRSTSVLRKFYTK